MLRKFGTLLRPGEVKAKVKEAEVMGLFKGSIESDKSEIGSKWKNSREIANLIIRGAIFVILTTFATVLGLAGAQSVMTSTDFAAIAIPLSTVLSIINLLVLRIKAGTLKEVFIQSFIWLVMYLALLITLGLSAASRANDSITYTQTISSQNLVDPSFFAAILIIPLGMFLGTLLVYLFRKLGKKRDNKI